MKNNFYNGYSNDLEDSSNEIKLPTSIKTRRKGFSGIRDRIVFYKQMWSAAETWAAFPKAIVYWLALTPLAITSFNGFVSFFGLEFEIPLDWGSTLAILTVGVFMIFGFLAWTKFGLNRRSMELGGKQNPNYFLLYKEIKKLREEIEELKK